MINKILLKFKNIFTDISNKLLGIFRRSKLIDTTFTIISNNCWGGKLYKYLNIPYNSPTCGLYFIFSDYIKFCSNLEYYLNVSLEEVNVYESHSIDIIKKNHKEKDIPTLVVGALDDIEIIFLHYKTFAEAKEKWIRRVKRVDLSKPILYKCNDNNGFIEENYNEWNNLNAKNKIFITVNKNIKGKNVIYLDSFNKQGSVDDTTYFEKDLRKNRYLDIINNLHRKV